MPVTAFYDARGKLLNAHVGQYDSSTLPSELASLYGATVTSSGGS
ncbi:MAG: hypothetical protein ACRD1G_12780 [Acidimicrobiales bacterium]